MIPDNQLRRYEIKQADGTWKVCQLANLEEGDVFRLFEPDGTPVLYEGCERMLVCERPSIVVEIPEDSAKLQVLKQPTGE